MASKYDLQRDNSYLETLKGDLNSVANNLNQSAEYVNKIHVNLGPNYKLNEDDVKSIPRTKNLENNINNEYNYIKNTVIPEIDAQISRNNDEIRRIEEEERRQREEEERKRKEAEDNKKAKSNSTSYSWR